VDDPIQQIEVCLRIDTVDFKLEEYSRSTFETVGPKLVKQGSMGCGGEERSLRRLGADEVVMFRAY
jgi:hypothetical protein